MAEIINPEPLVDAAEAARFLGVSVTHIRRLAAGGRIVGVDYGVGSRRFWRFRLSELALPVETIQIGDRP
ncbi:helix-turn-helix domain-containing protein [Granulicella tundricola]|uniref:helix-turn-helix domain-containing protein n=1 Tax=Granulicella tundricola TaxID=940615 RepID=UPI0001DB8014|nr:helix-turn-helix domain-containing protein [Granulicella tundricola]